ncbi:unnamed protein product [Tenebrio molitor]|nr:unnamed protein product [Tenebrio molitor]
MVIAVVPLLVAHRHRIILTLILEFLFLSHFHGFVLFSPNSVSFNKFKIMGYIAIIPILLSAVTLISCHVEPIVLVHGGADNIHSLRVEGRRDAVKKAATVGYKVLKKSGNVLDAVEEAIKIMEANEYFNAGYGSALNVEGEAEMDAAIMLGWNLSSGGVTVVKNIAHPISLARMVMEKSPHFLLAGEGAKKFARDQRVPLIAANNLISKHAKQDLDDYLHILTVNKTAPEMGGCGGVGAIAINSDGHLAAGTSTGGRLGKMVGRCSDASIIGAGVYADDEVGAAVVTGSGESIARFVLAHEIINTMKRGFEAGVATRNAVKGITQRFHKPTGAITLSKSGQVGISFTTDKMAWAYQIRDDVHSGIDDYDHFSEKIVL